MFKAANSRLVTADKRKGLVQLKNADGLMHFVWKDRTTGTEEDNLIIFPSEATFRKVEEAQGRVYLLEFKTSDKKLFFWMQEPKEDQDKPTCEKLNKYLENPPSESPSDNMLGALGLGDGGGALNEAQLMQLFGAAASSGESRGNRRAASSDSAPSSQGFQRSTLDSILAGIAGALSANNHSNESEDLVSNGLFDYETIVDKLVELLPSGSDINKNNLREQIKSSQAKTAIQNFENMLKGGELSALLEGLGVTVDDVQPEKNLLNLLRVLKNKKSDPMDTTQ
eukprot:TRINITY_DN1845_c0_g1_i1.p1 TRINITY_DN1845_c0_g1~~TRINITY_DN1845_c0_g1_i1.p1  ORF type:complete len:321 (+),score=65.38 TRINITY_DN1845_c0_g1_i1:119-964(+)